MNHCLSGHCLCYHGVKPYRMLQHFMFRTFLFCEHSVSKQMSLCGCECGLEGLVEMPRSLQTPHAECDEDRPQCMCRLCGPQHSEGRCLVKFTSPEAALLVWFVQQGGKFPAKRSAEDVLGDTCILCAYCWRHNHDVARVQRIQTCPEIKL